MRSEIKSYPFDSIAHSIKPFNLQMDAPPFVLILGPSAVGKSTFIAEISTQNKDFCYVSPYTTRRLRPDEHDKIYVKDLTFHQMMENGEFAYVKEYYGNLYGTPKRKINDISNNGGIPILDFPLSDVHRLIVDNHQIIPVYLFPESLSKWLIRLQSTNRNVPSRIKAGISELKPFIYNSEVQFDVQNRIWLGLVSREGEMCRIASEALEKMRSFGLLRE